jgi:hypothetical protein
MNHVCVTPRTGAIEARSGTGVGPPVSIRNAECARSGGSPEGQGRPGFQGVVASLAKADRLSGGLRLALKPTTPLRGRDSYVNTPWFVEMSA